MKTAKVVLIRDRDVPEEIFGLVIAKLRKALNLLKVPADLSPSLCAHPFAIIVVKRDATTSLLRDVGDLDIIWRQVKVVRVVLTSCSTPIPKNIIHVARYEDLDKVARDIAEAWHGKTQEAVCQGGESPRAGSPKGTGGVGAG